MTADKIALKAKLCDLFVNLGFGAAYICDDTVILYDILKPCEIFDIFVYRCTQKDYVAVFKSVKL